MKTNQIEAREEQLWLMAQSYLDMDVEPNVTVEPDQEQFIKTLRKNFISKETLREALKELDLKDLRDIQVYGKRREYARKVVVRELKSTLLGEEWA